MPRSVPAKSSPGRTFFADDAGEFAARDSGVDTRPALAEVGGLEQIGLVVVHLEAIGRDIRRTGVEV